MTKGQATAIITLLVTIIFLLIVIINQFSHLLARIPAPS